MATNGYVYVNSSKNGYGIYKSLYQAIARYTISNPDDIIVYIEEVTAPNTHVVSGSLKSHTYYFLGKNGVTYSIRSDAWYLYNRGGTNGNFYDSDEMDGFIYEGSWDNTGRTEYSLGGSGYNGNINYDYLPNLEHGFPVYLLDYFHKTNDFTFGNEPDKTKPFIGWTYNQLKRLFSTDLYYNVNTSGKNYNSYPILTTPDYLYNKYSSAFVDHRERDYPWWTDFNDIRIFYKTQHIYGDNAPNPNVPYQEDDFVFDGYPLFLNLHTTHNLEEAQRYLRDGTLPSDDGYIPSENGEPPTGADDSGGDDDDMDGMNNTSHTDRESIIISPTNNYYILEYNGLNNFCNWFWNDILTMIQGDYTLLGDYAYNMLTGAYGDLNQYVTSLRKLNINIDTFFNRKTNQKIKLGRYTLDNFTCDAIRSDKEDMPLLAEIQVPMCHSKKKNKPTFGSFLDYPPYTSVSIYIPFIGIVPIDGNMVVGRTIRLYGAVDVIAGTIHYNVFVQTPSKEWSLIGSYEGKCGVDIPLALDNSMQNSTNILSNVVDVTTGLCSKSPSALLNVGNGIFTEPISNLGAQSTNTTYYNPNRCALIMQTAIGVVPSNFGSTCGYMWCKSATLSELSGLTICKNPRIGNFSDNVPTDSERAEIYSLLQSGVII